MDSIYSLLFAGLGLCALMLVRNELTFRVRMRAIDLISEIRPHEAWQTAHQKYLSVSYESMMYDLSRWTFKQFYPWLAGGAK
jgi:hypothetical protein